MPNSRVSVTDAGMVIQIELGGIAGSAVWITLEERELCIHWHGEDDLDAQESRFFIPPGFSPKNAKASFEKGLLCIDVPLEEGLAVSKPFPMMIYCNACGKHFDIVVTNKGSENHRCPHCGEVQVFQLDSFMQKAIEQSKKMIRKPRRRP